MLSITLLAVEQSCQDLAEHLASMLIKSVAERVCIEVKDVQTLPVIPHVLAEGSEQENIYALLALHKRLYHRGAEEARHVLNQSGVPFRSEF